MVLYAKDIVETEFLTMPPHRSVLEAAKAMAARRHGFAIVMSPEGTPIGIVTEWDILAKVVAPGRNPSDVRLQDIMSPNLVSVDANEGIDRVAKLMAQDGTRRVLVTKDGKLLGVIRVQTILARMRDYIDSICAQIARSRSLIHRPPPLRRHRGTLQLADVPRVQPPDEKTPRNEEPRADRDQFRFSDPARVVDRQLLQVRSDLARGCKDIRL